MYPKLRGKIVEKFGAYHVFAGAMHLTPESISRKMTGRSVWTQPEIIRACEALGIPYDEIHLYFFTK